jgi:biotin transport system substrate-specific component
MSDVRAASFARPAAIVVGRRAVLVLAGALLVALGAQLAVLPPGTPVPITFQVPAVLIVGGLLGPRWGAASLALYLLMGVAHLPVFAPIAPSSAARLIGPTGGYLLAYPLAAAAGGVVAGDTRAWARVLPAMVVGTLVIHLGGVAQLAILGGDVGTAVRLGSVPFLIGDLVKVLLAGLVVRRLGGTTRALL